MSVLNKPRMVNLIRQNHWIVSICFTRTPPTHFIKIKWAKDLSFVIQKEEKKRRFSSSKIVPLFLKPWMNEQKISRILFVHPLKICEQYGFIQSCSYKSKASNRPWTIQQKSSRFWMTTKF